LVLSNPIKIFPFIQRALLQNILPTWNHILSEQGFSAITDQFFCPDPSSSASHAAGEVALISFSTILSLPLNDHSIRFLSLLAKAYPIDRLHAVVFSSSSSPSQSLAWEDSVRNIIAVPAKVANSLGGKKDIPEELEHGSYFNYVCLRSELLIWSISSKQFSEGANLPIIRSNKKADSIDKQKSFNP
jgi:telomere length regulation protein